MRILLVEDNKGDVRLLREAFRETSATTEIEVAEDGELALALLRRDGPHAEGRARPHLILLDLNLPKVDGKQVLFAVKNDPELRTIPVVVLSSSRSREDVMGSYANHANCYIRKPSSFDGFISVARGIQEFWLKLACLPDPGLARPN